MKIVIPNKLQDPYYKEGTFLNYTARDFPEENLSFDVFDFDKEGSFPLSSYRPIYFDTEFKVLEDKDILVIRDCGAYLSLEPSFVWRNPDGTLKIRLFSHGPNIVDLNKGDKVGIVHILP